MRNSLLSFLCALCGYSSLLAGDWPAWRGPHMDGHSPEKTFPLQWSDTENVQWKVPLPDQGNSTPIILGSRIFLTQATQKGHKRATICFDRRDGKQLWEQTIDFAGDEPTHETNFYCSASPATDGERVVVWHGSAGVFCYDLDGKEVWRRDLGPCRHIWGNGSSPAIFGNLVFINFGPGARTFLVALDKKSGAEAWKVDEPGGKFGADDPGSWIGSWSTPIPVTLGGRDELILSWPGVVKSFNPKTGEVLWFSTGLAKDKQDVDQLVYTSPLVNQDVIVAMAGYAGPALAIRPGGSGDVSTTHRLWRNPSAVQRIGSGVLVGEHIFMLNEPGTLQCIEWKTGKNLWTERLTTSTWGSLVHAGGRIYVTNRDGSTVVLAAQPKLEILSRNPLKETTQASLAMSDGQIFIRTFKHLWCIGTAKK